MHGANFCFQTDGKSVSHFKRTGPLHLEDDFFGFQTILPKYHTKVLELFRLVLERQANITLVFVYGELFGGGYPLPSSNDCDNISPVSLVQTEILYSERLEFYAFDVAFVVDSQIEFFYYDEACRLFETCGFFFARPLLVGSLAQCLEFDLNFQSTIPRLLGYPDAPGNFAEGVVIRPVTKVPSSRHSAGPNKERFDGAERLIFKRKAERFSERVQSYASISSIHDVKSPAPESKAEGDRLLALFQEFLTPSRVSSVLSKHGPAFRRCLDEKRAVMGKAVAASGTRTKMHAKAANRRSDDVASSFESLCELVHRDALEDAIHVDAFRTRYTFCSIFELDAHEFALQLFLYEAFLYLLYECAKVQPAECAKQRGF